MKLELKPLYMIVTVKGLPGTGETDGTVREIRNNRRLVLVKYGTNFLLVDIEDIEEHKAKKVRTRAEQPSLF